MSDSESPCRTIGIHGFQGSRSNPFVGDFLKRQRQARLGQGGGPESIECLLYVGHVGISIDGSAIFGFKPECDETPAWKVLFDLKNGESFPGVVSDDTLVFSKANEAGLLTTSFNLLVPVSYFAEIRSKLDSEIRGSKYRYGFPKGNGDCNCVTWIERLGVPLLTGRIEEWLQSFPVSSRPRDRRFGMCIQ